MRMFNALQHVGQGVADIETTYDFYRRHLGVKIKLSDLVTHCKEMAPLVGGTETMRMMMAANAKGGGVLELVEHRSSRARPAPGQNRYRNYGILEVGYGVRNIGQVIKKLEADGVPVLTGIHTLELVTGTCWDYAYIRDPDGLPLQLTEQIRPGREKSAPPQVLGVTHLGIGVSDMERSTDFYVNALGFDRLLCEFSGVIPELAGLEGEALPVKVVILERSRPPGGPLGNFLAGGTVKLIQVIGGNGQHFYRGRRWGDIGCMEFCLDVTDLASTVSVLQAQGVATCMDPVAVDMGNGFRGKVAYVQDPDGTFVELVQVTSAAWLPPRLFARIVSPLARLYATLT